MRWKRRLTGPFAIGAVLTGVEIAAASASPPAVTLAAAPPRSGWKQVASPHFVVASNASTDDARELARQLERVRTVFRETTRSEVDPPAPIVIFIGKDRNSVQKLLNRKDRTGVFYRSPFRQFMVLVGKQKSPNPYEVLYHEYVHLLNHLNYRRIPLWLDEGLATFFSYAFIDGNDLERTVLPFRTLLARESTIPLETFFTVDHASPYYNEGHRVSLFYAQSWAMTHLILVGDSTGELRRTLQDYLALLDAYVDPGVAYRRTFGRMADLELTLYNDVRKNFYYARLTPSEEIDGESFVVRDLSPAEWAARRAELLLFTGRPEDARPLLEQALTEEPRLAEAQRAMGILSYRDGDGDEAMKHFDEALALGDDDSLVHYYRGLLMRMEGDPETGAAEVEKSLARAVALNPRFAAAYAALADLYGASGRADEALAMAYMAAELDSDAPDYQLELARLRRRNGQPGEGAKSAARAVNLALQSNEARTSHAVCWLGSLAGFSDVVMTACERAVELAPGEAAFRDSRGLARALTGDYRGAVEDFRFFCDATGVAEETKKERRSWIEALTQDTSPFDADVLERLRTGSRTGARKEGPQP